MDTILERVNRLHEQDARERAWNAKYGNDVGMLEGELVRCEERVCPECHGTKTIIWHEAAEDGTGDGDLVDCPTCHGYGVVDEDGKAFERGDA